MSLVRAGLVKAGLVKAGLVTPLLVNAGVVEPEPEPELGPELIVNGDFETGDLTGWVLPSGGHTASVVANQAVCARNSGTNAGGIAQDVAVDIGVPYILSVDPIAVVTSATFNVTNISETTPIQPFILPEDIGNKVSWTITPTSGVINIRMRFLNLTSELTCDNISLKKVL